MIDREKAEIKSLVGLDIASKSIEEAQSRYKTSRSPLRYAAEFKTLDCFSQDLKSVIVNESMFNVVSVQFAFHYCFESEQKVDSFLATISMGLKDGGYFYGIKLLLGTVPNSALIVKMKDLHGKKFGNKHYYIDFVSDKLTAFGCQYVFKLEDAIDECPEFLVPIEKLIQMASKHGLKMVKFQPFHDFFMEQGANDLELVKRMRVFDGYGRISQEEWEVLGIYSVFCFQKD